VTDALIEVQSLSRRFGGVSAIDDVSFAMQEGEIIGLIGPNGAGKTTLVNLISGVHKPSRGRIVFRGETITRERPMRIARRGISRTFQIVQPFPEMTVWENVAAGALFSGGAKTLANAKAQAREQLEFVGLERFADRPATVLSLANRKRLELAKSLAMQPKLLMLDEVNAGLQSSEIDDALALIRKIAAKGITILIIEHLMKVVISVSQRLLVLHHGRLIANGSPAEVVRDRRVIEAYLGEKFATRLHALEQNA